MASSPGHRAHPPAMSAAIPVLHADIPPLHSDVSTPSDDDSGPANEYPTEDAQSLVGFSIGHAQSHFTSPTTPAAEKAAAMDDLEGDFFGDTSQYGLEGTNERHAGDSTGSSTPVLQEPQVQTPPPDSPRGAAAPPKIEAPPKRLPSPWRAGPKRFQRSDDARASLRDGLSGHKRSASSGGSAAEGFMKRLPFNIPSMPKSPSLLNFSFPGFSSGHDRRPSNEATPASRPRRSQTLMVPPTSRLDVYSSAEDTVGSNTHVTPSPRRSTLHSGGVESIPTEKAPDTLHPSPNGSLQRPTRPPPLTRKITQERLLRRTASDESLVLNRTLSRASSLGDDSRFEHVQEQVNSRIKAIKDSWQDANFKIPGIPSMQSLNISSSFTDLTRGRSGSWSLRDSSAIASRKATPSPLNVSRDPVEAAKKSPRNGNAGMTPSNAAQHPFFTQAAKDLTGDVVILGGYRGSILRSAEPPHRQLWVPIKVGLNLRKVDLEVGLNPEDEETMEERVIPGGMLTHVGPVDISRRLFKRLRASEHAKNGELRVHDYGYDWRLSPHLLSRKLIQFLEKLPCNKPGTPLETRGAVVIAHSLGGLVTRHAINQRPELFSGVIYAGVPTTCVNILGPLRNGDDVLLSSRVLTAQVNFTIRTSFALLPLEGKCFFDKHTKEEYPVDFFDVKTWIDHSLSPCVAQPLPPRKDAAPATGITGLMNSMASVLPSFPVLGRKGSISKSSTGSTLSSPPSTSTNNNAAEKARDERAKEASAARTHNAETQAEGGAPNSGMAPQMGARNAANPAEHGLSTNSNPATAVTLPREAAIAYLTRTLADIKRFKQDLAFRPDRAAANAYPPAAVIYGKSIPTVYGARVDGRDGIRRVDAYDELAFASGDGVVLARAAMVPKGYAVVRGGVVSSDRGHVTLLGDLEAVGRCLAAVVAGRKAGVGMGPEYAAETKKGEGLVEEKGVDGNTNGDGKDE